MRWPCVPAALDMRRLRHVPVRVLALLSMLAAVTAQMPYNPTRILQNGTLLYVFQPSGGSSSQFELRSIDISSNIDASHISHLTLNPSLPFLDSKTPRPFTPVLHNGGQITVYTGTCGEDASGAEAWTYIPKESGRGGQGNWKKQDLSWEGNDGSNTTMGPHYLSGGVAFGAVVDDDMAGSSAYIFGGMCPFQGGVEDWQSDATYSNSMVVLDPSKENKGLLKFQAEVSESRGPPIAEAGFTFTGLAPSYSNRSDGTQTQQQNFVLIGGHTSSAFINLSQVALFSLPQQGWTFVPVLQPSGESKDSAIRTDVDEVEPRSGHTAVLTPDGKQIVIFGGWIGDIDTPAEPQLAVLNVGEGYGGVGDWKWAAPKTSGKWLSSGSGLYGHGATMLPGGVMMIAGGYSISSSSSRIRRDTSSPSINTQTIFYNVTSRSWGTEYTPPEDIAMVPTESGPLSSTSQKAGLGAGLGIGMAAAISLLVFYLWYTKRLKGQRRLREKQLQELSLGAHRYTINDDCMSPGIDGRGGYVRAVEYIDDSNDNYFYPSVGPQDNRGWRQTHGHEAERTGLLVEIPSPTRGLRRSLSGRAQHHMNRYDERRVQGSGNIHPIDELEEEQDQPQEQAEGAAGANITNAIGPEMSERRSHRGASIFADAPALEPFMEKHTVSSTSAEQRLLYHIAPSSPIEEPREAQFEGQGTANLIHRRVSLRSEGGRLSPDKSDRTESNLSERSARSYLSSNGSVAGSASLRSAGVAPQANPFRTPDPSPTGTKSLRLGDADWEAADARTQSLTSNRSSRLPTAAEERDSFTTARTSFRQLQAEGEALLAGARPGTSSTSNGSSGRVYTDTEPSLSRAGTMHATTTGAEGTSQPRKRRWLESLGSVRKALARTTSTSKEGRTRSLTTTGATYSPPYTDHPHSPTLDYTKTENRKSCPSSMPPRRAASDAAFWRGKRGKQDWLDDELDPNDPRTIWRRNSGDDWGAPEDAILAEKEAQKRAWRERSSVLINLAVDDSELARLPTPRTPIHAGDLGDPDRANSLRAADEEEEWDVEAAVERRVVQVMFTVPKSKLRVVNADVDRSSILSLPRDKDKDNPDEAGPSISNASASNSSLRPADSKGLGLGVSSGSGSPNRVKDLVGRFEQVASSSPSSSSLNSSKSPRPSLVDRNSASRLSPSPRTSPSPSPAPSLRSVKLRAKPSGQSLTKMRSVERAGTGATGMRLASEDITSMRHEQ